MKGQDGSISKVIISLKYLPVRMRLDPSESINNQGTLRVDVLDAAELPAADRNGFSDPFCKFELNGENVYKTKVQKKTLHPAWNEYFETPIASRTAAKFSVRVLDWDFGDKADYLGAADINLEYLEPMQAQEVSLALDGKSGIIRLRLLFKSSYVTRSRQGSSTFSGTFATPGKIIGAPVKGVGKVGGVVGGGVVKGATFLRHGFKHSKDSKDVTNGFVEPSEMNGGSAPMPSIEVPEDGMSSTDPTTPPPFTPSPHNRVPSFGGRSALGSGSVKPDPGTAAFTILSASGYPPSAKVQVHIRQVTPKGAKEVHKTKGIKSPSGQCQWEQESFKVNCSPDCQFQIKVKDDKMFGDEDLGEAAYFIDDSGSGGEKTIKVGGGSVVLKSSFVMSDAASIKESSPKNRRSFLSKRDRDVSRGNTPNS